MKGQTFVILGLIVLILVSIFAITNVGVVDVQYFFWSMESPLVIVILFSVLSGVLISAAVSMHRIIRLQRELKKLKAKNAETEILLEEYNPLDELEENAKGLKEIESDESNEREPLDK